MGKGDDIFYCFEWEGCIRSAEVGICHALQHEVPLIRNGILCALPRMKRMIWLRLVVNVNKRRDTVRYFAGGKKGGGMKVGVDVGGTWGFQQASVAQFFSFSFFYGLFPAWFPWVASAWLGSSGDIGGS